MLYKILKKGYFSEDWLNEIGKIVDISPAVAGPAVEQGYLEEATKAHPIKRVTKRRKRKKK